MKLFKYICTALLLSSSGAKADSPSVHGMLLFGDKVTYASHLPMFHVPHDYQLIFKLDLESHPRSTALASYAQAKAEGKTLFTIKPEVMDLTKIIDGTTTRFVAQIYDGHFERGGTDLGPAFINVSQIVYSKKLDGAQAVQPVEEYLVFGSQDEYFTAHVIKSKPSFDTIASVTRPTLATVTRCGLRNCPPTTVPVLDEQLPISIDSDLTELNPDDVIGSPFILFATVVKSVIYFESGELSH